jgi:hydrogenase/urease accessory protein HupE
MAATCRFDPLAHGHLNGRNRRNLAARTRPGEGPVEPFAVRRDYRPPSIPSQRFKPTQTGPSLRVRTRPFVPQQTLSQSPVAALYSVVTSVNRGILAASIPSHVQVIGRYLEAGIAHIFLGYDHIAFLAAVVLWARRLWPVVKVVTAFTVAHSITLSLAALDIGQIPSAIIEPAIAASIVYVAVENFLSRDVEKRWRDAFGFGLIHGFGFASALQEIGMPRSALVPALASFNIGVEIGQIAIVCLVVPALLGMDRLLASDRGVVARPIRPSAAWRLAALASLVFRSALTPEHTEGR